MSTRIVVRTSTWRTSTWRTSVWRTSVWRTLTWAGALVAAGCGGGGADHISRASVSGRVTLDGRPLEGAQVLFLPEGSAEQHGLASPSRGVTDAEGRYTLRLELDGLDGALVGKHRVEIRLGKGAPPPPNELGLSPPAPADKLPARYNESSELRREITAAGTDHADFELTSQ